MLLKKLPTIRLSRIMLVMSMLFCLLTSGHLKKGLAQTNSAQIDATLWQKAQKLHQNAYVADAHLHKIIFNETSLPDEERKKHQAGIGMLNKGGVDAAAHFFAYYPLKEETLLQRLRKDMHALEQNMNNHQARAVLLKNGPINTKDSNFCIIPGLEYFFGVFDGNIAVVDSLAALGIRTITLMNNEHDKISYTKDDKSQALNSFGKQIINHLNAHNIRIDISHLPDDLQLEVIKHSSQPVIASHSPIRGVVNRERNLSDKVLDALAKKGGVVMITFNSGDLAGLESGRCAIADLVAHINYAVARVGVKHVGIGSDFNGAGLRSPKGLENAAGFPLITYHLLKDGYNEEEVTQIIGKTFVNWFNQ